MKEFLYCLTDSDVLRMCSELSDAINDCKVANGIHYCFCSGSDLCNGNVSQSLARTTARPMPQPRNEDDEDELPEGSGGGFLHTRADDSPTTARPPHGTTIANISPSHGSATVSCTLGLLPVMAAFVTVTVQ